MNLFSYQWAARCLAPLAFALLWWRGRGDPAYRDALGERWGNISPPQTSGQWVWLHAASVGEVRAAVPLITGLLAAGHSLHITTNTPTGRTAVAEQFGNQVRQSYPPFDTPQAVNRFLDRLHPIAAIRVELELWPTLLASLQARDIPIALVNARLSERSLRRYQRLGGVLSERMARISWVGAQTKADADRLIALGVAHSHLDITGSLKFDQPINPEQVSAGQQLRHRIGAERPVWVAASVREGEAQSVLAAHAMLCKRIPDALLILVPRHPERFVLPSLPAYGGADAVVYRTKASPITRATSILFADTMGELSVFLAAADIAFVGGSLVAVGGHNPLEPAALGLPVLMGPHVVNFAQVDRLLGEAGARYRVVDARSLATTLENLLTDAPARQAAGVQAQAVVEQHRGACKKTLTQLTDRLGLITK